MHVRLRERERERATYLVVTTQLPGKANVKMRWLYLQQQNKQKVLECKHHREKEAKCESYRYCCWVWPTPPHVHGNSFALTGIKPVQPSVGRQAVEKHENGHLFARVGLWDTAAKEKKPNKTTTKAEETFWLGQKRRRRSFSVNVLNQIVIVRQLQDSWLTGLALNIFKRKKTQQRLTFLVSYFLSGVKISKVYKLSAGLHLVQVLILCTTKNYHLL